MEQAAHLDDEDFLKFGDSPAAKALRERLGLQGVGGKRIWRNVPPAVVWTFTRPAGR